MAGGTKKQHGFELIRREEIGEISSEVFLYRHVATGARFVHVKNSDDNKVFSVAFRTPPSDHTGVAHIMEHSVLCGSEKFPTKDPFIELNKSSLKTFLNAMTYPDKTVYPVASRNRKDFFNLMDVYCDAVFHPLITKNKNIFLQEGWHYEMEDKEAPLRCNGVVYSEMKGAFSSPDNLLFRKILGSLYPDTPYGFVSGGDPAYIPDLTYEEFLRFHRLYYHPSNSYIYLYGDIETEDVLEFLQTNFLRPYKAEEPSSAIAMQKPFDALRESHFSYPVSKGEETREKTVMAYNISAGDALDPETALGMDILKYILLDTPASPLRRALLEEKIGKSVSGYYLSGIRQPLMSVIVKGSDAGQKGAFLKIVDETLRECAEKGLDHGLVEGAVNKKEFALREGDFQGFPRGLVYNIAALNGWLYDREPSLHLAFEEPLQRIKSQMGHGYFEGLIRRYLIDNPHASLLVMTPRPDMVEEMEQALADHLQKTKEAMSEEEIASLHDELGDLRRWQNTPDTPGEIASLPKLELSDIDPETERFPWEEYDVHGAKLLVSRAETNGILYDHIFYDMACVDEDLWPVASLLAEILGGIDTEKYDYRDLSKTRDKVFGQLTTDLVLYPEKDNPGHVRCGFLVQGRYLRDNARQAVELLREILQKSLFRNKERIHEIVRNIRAQMEAMAMDAGHLLAMKRLASSITAEGRFDEATSGWEFYRFIKETDDKFEEIYESLASRLEKVRHDVFSSVKPLFSVTVDRTEETTDVKKRARLLLPDDQGPCHAESLAPVKRDTGNEGIMIPGQVQYVAKGYDFHQLGYRYHGSLRVLATILKYDYLWNRIRVQGGAYGVFPRISRSGLMLFCSYRDPQLQKTLEAYDHIPEYVSSLELSEEEILKYIIGTISEIDTPVTPAMKGEVILSRILRGLSHADFQQERDEILQTTGDGIVRFSGLLTDVLSKNTICVVGSEAAIEKNSSLFESVKGFYD